MSDPAAKPVTHCVCHWRSFVEILEYAQEKGFDCLDELIQMRFCGCSCRQCHPYVEKALRTGETAFASGDIH
jgi:NAD(P)H-nitrite reductase large subunit